MIITGCGMAGFQVLVGIKALDQHAGFVGPFLIAVCVQIVAKVPGDIGEGCKAVDGVTDVAMLILASGGGMNLAVAHVEDHRDVHVAIARKLQHAIELLPIRQIEPVVVEAWVKRVVRALCRPGCNERRPGLSDHDRLAKKGGGLPAGEGHTQPVDFEPVQPIDAVLNGVVITKADQPIRGGSVEEVVLPGSLPDEVPWVLGIYREEAALLCFDGAESARGGLCETALLVGDGVLVIAGKGGHEADAEESAVGGVAEAIDGPTMAAVGGLQTTRQRSIFKRICGVGPADVCADLDEVETGNLRGGLHKRDLCRDPKQDRRRESGKSNEKEAGHSHADNTSPEV